MSTAIIYTGPTRKELCLRRFTKFVGGEVFPGLKEKIASDPAFANFFVPLSKFASKRRARLDEGEPATVKARPFTRLPIPLNETAGLLKGRAVSPASVLRNR